MSIAATVRLQPHRHRLSGLDASGDDGYSALTTSYSAYGFGSEQTATESLAGADDEAIGSLFSGHLIEDRDEISGQGHELGLDLILGS